MGSFWRHFRPAYRIDWPELGLLLALAVLFGWHVGRPVLHVWDEARLATNAVEMLRTGDWLITRYEGLPDLWNTKPPLLIWLQAASLHWLGYSVWAFRLPSTLAALATAWALYRFGRDALGSRFVGIFAALILATSPGFNGTHVARFGDYDTLLCLGLTATALCWYRYGQQRQARQLWWGALWFAVALLTKSAAAVLLLPAVGLYLLLEPAGRWVFGQGRTYAAVGLAFGPLLLFYGLREAAAPGYLAAVWFNDWYGRLSQHIVTVYYPWWIYAQRLLFPELLTWSLVLPAGIRVAFSTDTATSPSRRFARFACGYILMFLLILSVARTRLGWYSAPVFPLVALLCAVGLQHFARLARHRWRWPRAAMGAVLGLAVAVPAGVLLHHEGARWEAEKTDPMLHYGYQLPQLLATQPRLGTFIIVHEDRYNAMLNFYVAVLREQGLRPVVVPAAGAALQQWHPGQQVLIFSPAARQSVSQRYDARQLTVAGSCVLLKILGRK